MSLLVVCLLLTIFTITPSTVKAEEWGPKTPAVRISPSSGPSSTVVYVGIIDFPKQAQFKVYFASRDNLIATINTDVVGYAVTSFTVPERPAGEYAVLVTDGTTEKSAIYQLQPSCSVSNPRVMVNDNITVSGKCFSANQKATLYYDDRNIGIGSTDSDGNLKMTTVVPSSPSGIHILRLIDAGGFSASSQVSIMPSARLTPENGPVGTEVQVEAHGFSSNSDLEISTGQTRIAVLPASSNGFYRATFRVPAIQGVNDITIADKYNTLNIPFSVASTLSLSSSSGGIPSFVSLQGTGYKGGTAVTISFDDNKVGAVNTNPQGEFSFNLTVGKTTGGSHTIMVTDGVNVRKAQFAVETTPPPAPKPAFPKDKDTVNGDVTLAWGKVSDPSGVSYGFELARDKDFKDIILARTGLSEQDSIITADHFNHAAETWYYWRVRAVDGASNQGPWSEIRSFQTVFNLLAFIAGMPNWTKGGLAAILLVFLCFTCFWAGRMISVRREREVMA
jgi:hypothetical protein